jgi:hypothetical protein
VVNSTTGITDALEAGVFGDIGAAYFFNQHVSIAAAGDSRVTFGRVGSAPNDQSIVRFSILGPRILATLYF